VRTVTRNKAITESKRQERLLVIEHKKVAKGNSIANSLLAALPRKDYQRLLAGLERVTLTFGEVLYEPGEPIRYVYFPNDSLVSLLTTVEDHEALEVGLVGREGMVGISLALGIDVASVRALVQGTGTALRMKTARFHKNSGKAGHCSASYTVIPMQSWPRQGRLPPATAFMWWKHASPAGY